MKSPSNGVLVREPHVRIRRAVERRAWMAEGRCSRAPESAARDLLVHLYAERGSPKYEKAAMRWLERYLTERLTEAWLYGNR